MGRFQMALSLDDIRNMAAKGLNAVEMTDEASGAVSFLWDGDGKAYFAVVTAKGRVADYARASDRTNAQAWVDRSLRNLRFHAQQVAARKAARAAHVMGLKVGDILVSSWGYEQTNINYYEVTAVVGKTMVEVRPIASRQIASTGFMSETVTACPGQYTGEAKRCRVSPHDTVKISECQRASQWDGKPDHATHYA